MPIIYLHKKASWGPVKWVNLKYKKVNYIKQIFDTANGHILEEVRSWGRTRNQSGQHADSILLSILHMTLATE